MAKVKNEGGMRIIDPNPEGENVSHEDLMIYVKLQALTKSRSILKQEDDGRVVQLEQVLKNVKGETNYTYPEGTNNLTTDWTNIGGGPQIGGTNLGTFGITGIDIDIKSSFIPQVQINFVDIRGATLFEQGPCSPYASFFHMPYPVFELTVKGFYGKAVTYTLALRKFNTKFNSSTGNFEVKADFIGYTYAFLADLVMGYAIAAPEMIGGKDKLQSIWTKALAEQNKLNGGGTQEEQEQRIENQLPQNAVTIKDLIKQISELETVLGILSNTETFQEVSEYDGIEDKVKALNDSAERFIKELKDKHGSIVQELKSKYDNGGPTYLKILQTTNDKTVTDSIQEITKRYFGTMDDLTFDGTYMTQLEEINSLAKDKGLTPIDKISVTTKNNQAGFYSNGAGTLTAEPIPDSNGDYYYYFDIGESFLLPNSKFSVELDKKSKNLNETLVDYINEAVKKTLGYVPTVRNIMTILLTNMETFLHLLVEASIKAENVHDAKKNQGITVPNVTGDGLPPENGVGPKVYPWPTYYAENDKVTGAKGTSVEQYPGENPNLRYFEEVKFVEDFLRAYLRAQEDIALITGDVEGKRGFDNMIPMNPMESRLFDTLSGGNKKVKPNAYFRDEDRDTVIRNIAERAFLVGDHTTMNGLIAWKSRELIGSGGLNNPLSGVFENNKYPESSDRPVRLTDDTLIYKFGYVDGINAVNTLETSVLLQNIKAELDNGTITTDKLIESLGTDFESRTFDTWVQAEGLGVSSADVHTLLKNMRNVTDPSGGKKSYFDDIKTDDGNGSDTIYSYKKSILVGDDSNSEDATPNPHDGSNTFLILDVDEIDSTTTLTGAIQTWSTETAGPWGTGTSPGGFADALQGDDKKEVLLGVGNGCVPDISVFTLDSKARVPTVTEDKRCHFLKLPEWSLLNNTYSIGSIDKIDTTFGTSTTGPLTFGSDWDVEGVSLQSALITSPLWARNLHEDQEYKRPVWNDSTDKWTSTPSGKMGFHVERDQSIKALSYLNLITIGYADSEDADYEDDEGYCSWYDYGDMASTYNGYSAVPFFRTTGSQVKVPKHFTLLTGAILWRLREAGQLGPELPSEGNSGPQSIGNDPILRTTNTSNAVMMGGFKDFKAWHHPHLEGRYNNLGKQQGSGTFLLIQKDSYEKYSDMRFKMRTLFKLPVDVQNQFIRRFESWSLGDFKDKYLNHFDPLSSGNLPPGDYYSVGDAGFGTNRYAVKNGGNSGGYGADGNNTDVENMYKYLFEEFDTIGYATPKAFYAIDKGDFSKNFNIRKKEFDAFFRGWKVGFQKNVEERLDLIRSGKDGDQSGAKKAMDDPDIKLNLYKSFKSIFDKWVARSADAGGGDYKLFYNKVINNPDKTKLLIDHFNFIDRGFNDIGYKAVVDVTLLKDINDNPTDTLYQTVSELLSKNNFDFHPLPSFIQYSSVKDEDLGQMFEPVTDLEGIDSGPSFICMYIGGTSTNLDIGAASTFCNDGNQTEYLYEDDSFKFTNSDGTPNTVDIPKDVANKRVTAFLVSYGIENQSHFKSVALDQAEFKETQESLMVIDQISKGGDESNRASKGQNLYNVYQTRSYTCTVESLGNMQIQPLMYFELTNVPMFWGAYLITEVKHTIQPNNVTTTFSGTRVPKIVLPIVTDAYSTMVLSQTDANKTKNQTAREYLDSLPNHGSGSSGSPRVGAGPHSGGSLKIKCGEMGGEATGVLDSSGAGGVDYSGLKPIKDLLGQFESNNTYNIANVGECSKRSNLSNALTTYTYDQIKEFSDRPYNNCNNFDRLFAIGRYQIIPNTLKGRLTNYKPLLDSNFGPGKSGKFTKEIQELTGESLLLGYKQKGLSDYLLGKNSGNQADLEQAIQGCGQEWASFPVCWSDVEQTTRVGSVDSPESNVAFYGGSGANPSFSKVCIGTVAETLILSRRQFTGGNPAFTDVKESTPTCDKGFTPWGLDGSGNLDGAKSVIVGSSTVGALARVNGTYGSYKSNKIYVYYNCEQKTLAWLQPKIEADGNKPRSDVKSYFQVGIGTNDGYKVDQSTKNLISKYTANVKKKFPNTKLYVIPGTRGWVNVKNKSVQDLKDYYNQYVTNGWILLWPSENGVELDPYFDTSAKAHNSSDKWFQQQMNLLKQYGG